MAKVICPEPGSQLTIASETAPILPRQPAAFVPPMQPTEAMLDAMRCAQGCRKPCPGCDAEATRYWLTMYAAAMRS